MNIEDSIPILRCEKCFGIPLVFISSSKPPKIKLNCKCGFEKTFQLNAFLNYLKEEGLKKSKCQYKIEHITREASEYCISCKKWFCSSCLKEHNKTAKNNPNINHKTYPTKITLEDNCFIHSESKCEYFCMNCKIPFCKECSNFHKNHLKEDILKLLTKEKSEALLTEYIKAKDYVVNYADMIKSDAVLKLKKCISNIEKSYNKFIETNTLILDLIKIIIHNFEDIQNNAFTITNMKNWSEFNLKKSLSQNEEDIKKILEYPKFFESHIIIDHRNIKDLTPKINLNNISLIKEINAHDDWIKEILLLSDGRLASCSMDKNIKIFNLNNYQCDISIPAHDLGVLSIAELTNIYPGIPNTSIRLISSSSDRTIKIWEINQKEYKLSSTLTKHNNTINKVISLSNNRFASCCNDTEIIIWKSISPYEIVFTLKGHKRDVNSMIQIKDKENLLSCSIDSEIILWDIKTYKMEKVLKGVRCASNNSISQINDDLVIIGEYNTKNISFIDLNTFTVSFKISNDLFYADLKNNFFGISGILDVKDSFICGSPFGGFIQIEYEKGKIIAQKNNTHGLYISSLIKINENLFASASYDKKIKIWNNGRKREDCLIF